MRLLNLIFVITLFAFQQNGFATDPIKENATPKTHILKLKKGTKVTLMVNDLISSREAESNNVIELTVLKDVKVNGKVVVFEGTFAEGVITDVRRAGIFGRGAKLEFEGINILAADGQRIPIKSLKVKKRGKNRKGMALGASIIIPVAGVLMGTPLLIPFGIIGIFVKGRDVEIQPGTLVTAKIMEDTEITLHQK